MPDKELFCKLPRWLMQMTVLSEASKTLWTNLRDREGKNGYCWPSWKCLMADHGRSRNAIREAIKELERAGMLKVKRRNRGGRRMPNQYKTFIPGEPLFDW